LNICFLRSVPGKRVLDVSISAVIQPTDQMSTEKEAKIVTNVKLRFSKALNMDTITWHIAF